MLIGLLFLPVAFFIALFSFYLKENYNIWKYDRDYKKNIQNTKQ